MNSSEENTKQSEALHSGPSRGPVELAISKDEIRRAAQVHQSSMPTRPVEAIHYRRDLPISNTSAPSKFTFQPRVSISLQEAVPGSEVTVPARGAAYVITTPLQNFSESSDMLRQQFITEFAPESSLQRRLSIRCHGNDSFSLEDILFVDLETTGLGNSPLFLIGVMTWEDDNLLVRQYLARHYGEESAVTALFIELASRKRLLVSFNGKSFDFPYLRARAAANAIAFNLQLAHFDMLHESRREWKRALPNCKLQTLEHYICGRQRQDDIPGHLIPEAYHSFVRSANAVHLAQIIKHNLLDIVTLGELMVRLPTVE